ncbi:glycosyltransferase family A protein [Merdimonas faecis]|uniref:glycosyltransferase family 2 protein n=1 Tax=Merdimonas faecis TaxID=1653435 RepID=UPI0032092DA4
MDKKTITVFTPAYNRADTLNRGYQALCRQTLKDFVWLIVDDGSTDNTKEVVAKWKQENNGFEIIYIYKKNGGLHTGYNVAIANADTELMMCVDSDDYLPDDAIERIVNFWRENGSDKYAGIVGLDYDLQGHVIGDPLPGQKSVNLIDLLIGKYPIYNGDRKNIVRTELYKAVSPMKSFPGEKNFNPHYMHLQISEKYDFLVLNENLCYVEYQPEGMSASILKQYRNSPRSFAEIRKLYLSFRQASLKFKVRQYIHYWSSCMLAGSWCGLKNFNPLLLIFSFPVGVLLSFYIRVKTSKHKS